MKYPDKCPKCKSSNIETIGSYTDYFMTSEYTLRCNDCKHMWEYEDGS
jgi:transposase-like protein